ncbi:hypothetical protein ABTM61_19290, partial [Acinetobacter baumannii]
KTQALSNTKQIATANLIYINDYDDIIVPGLVKADAGTVQGVGEASPGSVRTSNSFDILLYPYLKNIDIWFSPVSDKVSGNASTRSITQNA